MANQSTAKQGVGVQSSLRGNAAGLGCRLHSLSMADLIFGLRMTPRRPALFLFSVSIASSVCPSVCLCVCLSACLSVCLSVWRRGGGDCRTSEPTTNSFRSGRMEKRQYSTNYYASCMRTYLTLASKAWYSATEAADIRGTLCIEGSTQTHGFMRCAYRR